MVISTEGAGERSLYVSYISEVPVWKSTYRIVLNSKPGQSALLQAWAIVDNTVGEDWQNVQLSLVAGAPQSFIQNLSQPYYSRRPVVRLPENVTISPQTHEATLVTIEAQLNGALTDASSAGLAGVSATQPMEAASSLQMAKSAPPNPGNVGSERMLGRNTELGSGIGSGSGNGYGAGTGGGMGGG